MTKGVFSMQVKNINIKNFKCIEDKTIPELNKFTVITGSNGSGKTSLLNAIRFAVTGVAPSDPIRSGCNSACVEVELFGSTITRTIGDKNEVRVNGKKTTAKSVKDFIEANSGVSYDTAKIAVSSDLLRNMSGGAFAEYLVNSGMIPATVDFTMIKKLCPTITSDVESQLRLFLPDKFNLDDISDAYTNIFGARKALKKNLEEKKIATKYEGGKPSRTIAEIDADINKIVACDAEIESYNKLLKQYDIAVKNRDRVLSEIKGIENKIKSIKIVKVDPKEEKFLRDQLSNIDEQIRSAKSTIELIKSNNKMFEKTLSNLDKPVCPISEKLICTTDKTEIKDELNTLVNNNNEEIAKQNNAIANLLEKRKKIVDKINDYNERVKQYQLACALNSQLKAYKSSIPALPEKPVKPKENQDTQSLKKALYEERDEVCKYNNFIKAQAEIKELEKLLEVYKESLDILKPSTGIRGKIIELALDPLIKHANTRAAELKLGFTIKLVSDNGISIMCSPNTSCDMIKLESVSSGEQAYALFLVMDALNALSGYGILVLDDLDKLDENALDALLSLLEKPGVMNNYDHVLMAMVNHKDSLAVLKKHEKSLINNFICI